MMTAPPPVVPEIFAFEGASTSVGQESSVLGRGTAAAAAAAAGGRGEMDLCVAALAPLPQDVFAPEVNMTGQCGTYGRRRPRLPCFMSFQKGASTMT
ncbi:unnamed protein product [Ectocarpus sp. 8 AP-2014]